MQLQSCISKQVVTVWKSELAAPVAYNKIMVAVIMGEGHDSLRLFLEKYTADQFSAAGYYSVAAMNEYGPNGLGNLDAEATYRALCDSGIDAVLVLAMIDKKLATKNMGGEKYNSEYYYKRIWRYRPLLDQFNGTAPGVLTRFAWEGILFDLNSLQPESVIQIRRFNQAVDTSGIKIVADQIVKEMRRKKIIVKKDRPRLYKPF